MNADLLEWLNLLARWVHVIAGIMWVGNSMLFNWLDRNLQSADSSGPTKFGETWLLHSGGFYRVEKFMLKSSELPPVLHWFKWQSYTTWISGVCLLILIYFSGRGAFLLDPRASSLSYGDGVALAVAVIAGGWMVYDLLWRMPFGGDTAKRVITGTAVALAVYFLCDMFSGRAAYLLAGAMLGTFMSGNVFFHIIPSQKEMVAAIAAGRGHDLRLADRAKERSIHNNYFTFPVIFAMLSNHYGGLYGHHLNWLILLLVFSAAAAIRHFMNIRFTYKGWLPAATGIGVAAACAIGFVMRSPDPARAAELAALPPVPADASPVTFADARAVIQIRCVSCHSAMPTDPVFAAATGGVHFDTPEQILQYAARIKERAVVQQTMPLANKTAITPAERMILGRWVDAGAPGP